MKNLYTLFFLILSVFTIARAQDQGKHYIKTTTFDLTDYNQVDASGNPVINQNSGAGIYNDFNRNLTLNELFTCGLGGGGFVKIVNNVLTVSFSNSGVIVGCSLKLGPIVQLNTSPMLPDMDLGVIKSGTDVTTYSAKIKNGWLYFYSKYHFQGVNDILKKSFEGTPVNYYNAQLGNIYTCVPVCTTCGTMASQITIDGNTVEVNFNSSWQSGCYLKTGEILTLSTSSPIPNMDLGYIKYNGLETGYRVSISSNKLFIISDNSAIIPTTPPAIATTDPLELTVCLGQVINPMVSSESVIYYDDFGNQTQVLSYDSGNKRVWGKEYQYDNFGRVAKESYPTPFDQCRNEGWNPVSLLDNPNSPLYYYYGDANTEEPYKATADLPQNVVNHDVLNPGNIISITGGNMVNGQWKTGYSYTVPAAQELYYLFGLDYYNGPQVFYGETVITNHIKVVDVDENGVENVSFYDADGLLLATARSGGTVKYPVVSVIGEMGYVDVHIPQGISTADISLIGSVSQYEVYDLTTGVLVTGALTGGKAYRIVSVAGPEPPANTYITTITTPWSITPSSNAKGIQYKVNYYDYSLNVYNNIGQVIRNIQPNRAPVNPVVVAAPGYMLFPDDWPYVTFFKYNTLGQLIETFNLDEGRRYYLYRDDGLLRYWRDDDQVDKSVNYNNYDTLGRIIESGNVKYTTGFTTRDPYGPLLPGVRSEQVFTVYDAIDNNLNAVAPPLLSTILTQSSVPVNSYIPKHLNGNVAITYKAEVGGVVSSATWYSYDIYGRTEWIVQWTADLGAKTLDYRYNAKGNVSEIYYDQAKIFFQHMFLYDDNNRLAQVSTRPRQPFVGTLHAKYSYYSTGELKRIEYGGGIQGVDYVYTLDGKLKSINSTSLTNQALDPGHDTNDLFGMTIDYHMGDYEKAGTNISTSESVSGYNTDQYNGNIKAIRFANRSLDVSGTTTTTKAYVYKYDRNNWLTSAAYGANSSGNVISLENKYRETGLTYDANGNILTLQRSDETGFFYDNLQYYTQLAGSNRLAFVRDNAGTTSHTYDIEPQLEQNYTYYRNGNLKSNVKEGLEYIYDFNNLIKEIKKNSVIYVKFYYNERGQRIKKEVFNALGTEVMLTDYYVNDLEGNPVAIFNKVTTGAIILQEHPIYGLGRIGVYKPPTVSSIYEITDHLGNVRVVFKKSGTSAVVEGYTDYYPFGEPLPGRNLFSSYRYAFQGQELDQETGMEAFELRSWDGRIGRWLCPDPYRQYDSSYLGMGNNPISTIDLDGGLGLPLNGLMYLSSGIKGIGKSFINNITGAAKSLYYLGDTGEGLYNLGLTSIAQSGIFGGVGPILGGGYTNTLIFDAKFGTNTSEAYAGMGYAIENHMDKMTSGDLEVSSEATFDLVFGVFGTKGLGNLGKVAKVNKIRAGLPHLKLLRGNGGKINGFTFSRGSGYGAKPRLDFHELSNTHKSRQTSRMTIPKWLDGKKIFHYHRGKGNNLRYHRPWEVGPDGKRRW